jgi:prophage maintenance system killer protein
MLLLEVYKAGYIRNLDVRIGGTNWKPEIPNEIKISQEIENINRIENVTERAITLMLYSMRTQMFIDGNKRTSMLAGNHIMISNGAGIISVPLEHQKEFRKLLIKFYESNHMGKIKEFIYTECIDGMYFEKIRDKTLNENFDINQFYDYKKKQKIKLDNKTKANKNREI